MLISLLALSIILFCIGLYGVLVLRNWVLILFSIALMFQSVHINLITFSRYGFSPSQEGEVFSIFSLLILVANMMVGLSFVIPMQKKKESRVEVVGTKEAKGDVFISLVSCFLFLITLSLGRLWF